MPLDSLLAHAGALLALGLALGAAVRGRRAVDRWAFFAGMLALGAERIFSGLQADALTPFVRANWQIWQLMAGALVPATWLLFSLTYARGNAAEFVRRWSWVLGLSLVLPLGTIVLLHQGMVTDVIVIDGNESRLLFQLGTPGMAFHLVQLVVAVLVLMNLERTFRAAVGTVRWRIKFFLMGVGLLFLVRLYLVSQTLIFRHIDPGLDTLQSGALLVAGLLILRSLFRAGHFNLDVYPSHTVLQGSMTVLLAGIYLLIVGVFAKIVAYLGGDSSFALKTLVFLVCVVVLAVLVQSDRVQLQLRRFVSRHFQRPTHDYRMVWRRFTEATATQVELTEFCRAVANLLAEIFQSLSVTVWLLNDRRDTLTPVASTFLTDAQVRELPPTAAETAAIIPELQSRAEPVDIEHLAAGWAAALRRCHPDTFHKGGTRVAVPVAAGGELLGVVLLGDRVSGAAFTLQDLELLKSLGDQVASSLLNLRLSQRLLQTREHEAFQTMATFFVHDLKNAASTLTLVLQNLPEHFDDPAFREDALRTVGKSVAHINHLIRRLTQLQHGMRIEPVDADLNAVVAGAAGAFAAEKDCAIELNPGTLPRLPLDPHQFASVVTNLVLNAREAGATRVRLTTSQVGGRAVLEVADDGSGMSAAYLQHSLFRPFQTTKKNGLGIGMFQSKMIVEAHGGRMAVESAPGQGTTFRIFLPLTA